MPLGKTIWLKLVIATQAIKDAEGFPRCALTNSLPVRLQGIIANPGLEVCCVRGKPRALQKHLNVVCATAWILLQALYPLNLRSGLLAVSSDFKLFHNRHSSVQQTCQLQNTLPTCISLFNHDIRKRTPPARGLGALSQRK